MSTHSSQLAQDEPLRYRECLRPHPQAAIMRAPDPTTDGTLEVLDDLHEDGRRRYIKRRSKEELDDIIIAAWRNQDECKKLDGTHPL